MKKSIFLAFILLVLIVTTASALFTSGLKPGQTMYYYLPDGSKYMAGHWGIYDNPLRAEVKRCQMILFIPINCVIYVMPEWNVWYQEDGTFPEAYWDLATSVVTLHSTTKTLGAPIIFVPIQTCYGITCPPQDGNGYPAMMQQIDGKVKKDKHAYP